jgi:hypothetical protein
MRRPANMPRPLCSTLCLLLVSLGGLALGQQSGVPNQDMFPGVTARPIDKTPLSEVPYVFKLETLEPAEMSSRDASAVSSLSPKLAEAAARSNFDLTDSGWRYRQVGCPAFPDYIFLAYSHGPSPNGSSRFVAALRRDGADIRIVSTVAHGMLPLNAAWSKSGSYEIFNRILLEERGVTPLSRAPNWLVLSMCYAELTGNHVQVFTSLPLPGSTSDLLRLDASLPQLNVGPDQAATVTFSDASIAAKTTNWILSFDRHGQLTSVSQSSTRQPAKIALKP